MCAVESAVIAGGRKPDAALNCRGPREYRARNPFKNPLNRLVLDNLLEFEAWLKEPPAGKPCPHCSVITALEKFSECGVLRYGAVRYRCPECGHDVFVAFSCKRRGLCPSCDAKRSAIMVAAALDRLLGYCSHPALSLKRLVYASKSKIVLYHAQRHDGRPEMMTMSPVEFLRRWGLLMPPPHKNLVHYYGALAPRSPLRAALTAQAGKEVEKIKAAERTEKLKNKAHSWAACLARVFEVFPLICPKCRVELKPVAVILEDKELVRLLTHFGLPTEFPAFSPAPVQYAAKRGPPDEDCQINPLADQYDNIDPPSPED